MPVAGTDALLALGVPAQLAELMGATPATQAGSGTTQAGTPTILKSKSVELTASGGNTAFIMNSGIGVNEPIFVFNSSGTTALVFPPLNGTLNNSTTVPLSVGATQGAWIWQYKKGFWASVLTH